MEKQIAKLKKANKCLSIISAICVFFLFILTCLIVRGVLNKSSFSLSSVKEEKDRSLLAWKSCLEQMDYSADIVFFGDSITQLGDFQKAYPNLKIINLGLSGDSVVEMSERTEMVGYMSPKKVFIMAGINSMHSNSVATVAEQYKKLLMAIESEVPKAEIYVHSVLPVSKKKEKEVVNNRDISSLNNLLEEYAKEQGYVYIDLYSLMVSSEGELDSELTTDGLHLNQKGNELWNNLIEDYVVD